jgi:hypothetical protein
MLRLLRSMPSCSRPLPLLPLVLLAAACSRSPGPAPDPGIAATVPAGTGVVSTDLTGTWEIRAGVVMETNLPNLAPPASGTIVVIAPGALASIGGLGVSRPELESVLGAPLDLYVNRVDGRTVIYGLTLDRRATGGTREEVALAGGTVNADTLAVEQYTSTLQPNAATAGYTLARYTLVRVATSLAPPSAAATAAPAEAPPSLLQALAPLLGGR